MFSGGMGVSGCALSTLIAEIMSAAAFLVLLAKRKLIQVKKIFRLPKWSVLSPLITRVG
jgi:Na+-driven multidrug efflux pump